MANHFRIKPLGERNWLAMFMALVLLALCAVVILAVWPAAVAGDWYFWLVLSAMTLAGLSALLALITGDTEYFLLGVLIQWQR